MLVTLVSVPLPPTPTTAVGTGWRKPVNPAPCPSSSSKFDPQENTPPGVRARLLFPPAEIAVTPESPLTVAGTLLSTQPAGGEKVHAVPSPSCPKVLLPQATT